MMTDGYMVGGCEPEEKGYYFRTPYGNIMVVGNRESVLWLQSLIRGEPLTSTDDAENCK